MVYAEWEGSAQNSRVLRHAIENDHFQCPEGNDLVFDVFNLLVFPHTHTHTNLFHVVMFGKYYLADAGYATRAGFITPYRGEWYHLKDYSVNRNPTNPRELFNHHHSSLRICVERAFGLLKGRFKILNGTPTFPYKTQVAIGHACCVLHNYILDSGGDELMLPEDAWVAQNRRIVGLDDEDVVEANNTWVQKKDQIAADMWANYILQHNDCLAQKWRFMKLFSSLLASTGARRCVQVTITDVYWLSSNFWILPL